jgi:hypothetical protein
MSIVSIHRFIIQINYLIDISVIVPLCPNMPLTSFFIFSGFFVEDTVFFVGLRLIDNRNGKTFFS